MSAVNHPGVASKPTPDPTGFVFHNSYARLPEQFHARVRPSRVAAPALIRVNRELAQYLGLDPEALASPDGVAVLSGNRVAAGSEPLAMAYAGHQFGHFVPQLGDGRANLLGEVIARDGVRYDIQLKGSGPTPFSRRGDGRAALGPVLREYILSEAMAALGVPTTRALAAVTTGEPVVRETLLPGAVFTRVARSHLRVGSFQYFAARGDADALKQLAGYAIERHYPEAAAAGKKYRAFLDGVIARQARLIAQWMLLGFIHGVMNTDNMSIAGETIDYGPCAFMEAYSPDQVYSSIDQNGRYAFSNQPAAAHWNLARLAEALLPLLAEEEGSDDGAMQSATDALGAFAPEFVGARTRGLRQKLGLLTEEEGDLALADALLERMAQNDADYTLTFRRLADAAEDATGHGTVRELFRDPEAYDSWAAQWRSRTQREPGTPRERATAMRLVSPVYIPRNHQVEAVIQAALRHDFAPFAMLVDVGVNPFAEQAGHEAYARPARPEECVSATFCGT